MKSHDLLLLGIILTIIGILLSVQPIFTLCRLRRKGPHKFDYNYRYGYDVNGAGADMKRARQIDEDEDDGEEGPEPREDDYI